MMRSLLIFLVLAFIGVQGYAQCISGDCRNGRGIYVYPSGAKYIGEFKDGEIHGIGTCYYTNGSKYQGEWQNRFPHGQGTKVYEDGFKYSGLWLKGKPVDKDGNYLVEYVVVKKEESEDINDIQSGCLAGECQNGQGTFAYPDGSKYDGQFVEGKLQGLGTWYFTNGDRYVGAFKNNFPNGKGVMYTADGVETKGEWRDGEYVGTGESKSQRQGCIEGDCENGDGKYVFRDATATYTGSFEESKPNGNGIVEYANGDRYEGEFEDGLFHGQGTLRQRDGTEIRGNWIAGQYQAPVEMEEAFLAARGIETKDTVHSDKKHFPGPRKIWAVIVGVANYNHMPALRYTDDDAYRFYAFLKSAEGGGLPDDQIRILIDEEATRQRVLETTSDLFSKASEGDLVLYYFSGHGVKGSFLPIDFDGFNNRISYEEISQIINDSPARYRLCFADACHSGGLFSERSGAEEEEWLKVYQDLYQTSTGTAIIMSSKSEETSLESSGLRQGVFSHFMIRGLKGEADSDGDGQVSIQELYDFIYVQVRAYTGMRQSPVIKGDYEPNMPVAIVRNTGR
jgi:hypothetical protein